MTNLPTSFTCSKKFEGYPCCHRQWRHEDHCRFVHGYSRSFKFGFAAKRLDDYGFVVDFSSLRSLEKKLKEQFDHTFLVNSDDPYLDIWKRLHKDQALDLRIMENVGMEGTSRMIWSWANELLLDRDSGRTCCFFSESSENNLNSARYDSIPKWFQS
tara:strand:- start:149 stop:619 length:471 start_codon:yes stop_codon:yes gene_type:complete